MTGTGDAASFAYTKSVIEYASAADMAEVNTLKKELTGVTDLQDASLTPGTVELILGSDFTGLNPERPPRRPPSQTSAAASARPPRLRRARPPPPVLLRRTEPGPVNGGITAAAACASDSSAFAGPLSP